ncbi:hypothetical protein [Geothrix limicola]|uniref:hypothetical protein n=1 Tax=Geothrix limicola TaxID=2927978 RepID=UPI00255498C2|nr:hypothetical protein [Geothrix limicola]
MHMFDQFLLSFSPISGIVVIGVLSAIAALATSWIKPELIRWIALYGVPILLAYFLYWHTARAEGGTSGEYAAWQFVFIIIWGGAGILASSIVSDFIQRRRTVRAEPSA